jgi:hypothetical protein
MDDPDTMRAPGHAGFSGALITPPEDRARPESTIQLVCRSLQAFAWAHQRTGTAEHQREAAEAEALRRWIVEEARAAGLRITDDCAGSSSCCVSGEKPQRPAFRTSEHGLE